MKYSKESRFWRNCLFIWEVWPHCLILLTENQYDNIFHEHIGFHSLKSIIDRKRNKLQVLELI